MPSAMLSSLDEIANDELPHNTFFRENCLEKSYITMELLRKLLTRKSSMDTGPVQISMMQPSSGPFKTKVASKKEQW